MEERCEEEVEKKVVACPQCNTNLTRLSVAGHSSDVELAEDAKEPLSLRCWVGARGVQPFQDTRAQRGAEDDAIGERCAHVER